MADPVTVATSGSIDWRTIAVGACSLIMAVLSFLITGMREEMRRQAQKVAEIDREYIKRSELHRELEDIREHIEDRHKENRDFLKEISGKIDLNEEREAKTRHDIRDAVNTLVIQQSVFQEKIELWRKENERTAASAAEAARSAAEAASRAFAATKSRQP